MTKTVLITGGFGTLGGRLAKTLANTPDLKVRLASRGHREPPPWHKDAEVFKVDYENTSSITQMLHGVTHIVHLASMNDYECKADPIAAKLVNVEYTQRIVERVENKAKFIYLSTIQVYGKDISGIISESSPTNAIDSYSLTHLQAEEVVKNEHEAGRFVGVRLRCANGFGAPMSADAKIWQIIANDLCRQAVESQTLTLKSDGLQYRNFVCMKDICNAIIHMINLDTNQIKDGLFNLGGEKSVQVIKMAELIVERCEKTLGFRPPINLPAVSVAHSSANFDFTIDKIISTGFKLINDMSAEIDELLIRCNQWFKYKN